MSNTKFKPLGHDYKSLLQEFARKGYGARSYTNFNPNEKHLILRHDIDLCLERALRIAKIEAEMGWSAVYFVLLSSPFYNSLEQVNVKRLKEIAALGHEIGLHLELEADVDLQEKANFEASILRNITGCDVQIASFHRPTANANMVAYEEIALDGLMHTYESRFFRDIAYVSDSRGGWYYGHPLDHENVKNGQALQLLTHPIWWTSGPAMSPRAQLIAFHKDLSEKTTFDLKDNFKIDWDDNQS